MSPLAGALLVPLFARENKEREGKSLQPAWLLERRDNFEPSKDKRRTFRDKK